MSGALRTLVVYLFLAVVLRHRCHAEDFSSRCGIAPLLGVPASTFPDSVDTPNAARACSGSLLDQTWGRVRVVFCVVLSFDSSVQFSGVSQWDVAHDLAMITVFGNFDNALLLSLLILLWVACLEPIVKVVRPSNRKTRPSNRKNGPCNRKNILLYIYIYICKILYSSYWKDPRRVL